MLTSTQEISVLLKQDLKECNAEKNPRLADSVIYLKKKSYELLTVSKYFMKLFDTKLTLNLPNMLKKKEFIWIRMQTGKWKRYGTA